MIINCRVAYNHKQFQQFLMSSNKHKNQIQSLSSLSLQQNLRDLRDSQVFPNNNRKSTFDLVNFLNDSGHFNRKKFEKSLDMFNSSIAVNKSNQQAQNITLLQLNQDDKIKIQKAGGKAAPIQQIDSQSDPYSDEEEIESLSDHIKLEDKNSEASQKYKLNEYLPFDLAKLLLEKQIPLCYVRGLLLVKDQKQIKTVRRLKVQRYLQKRRKKTWNKKICYNCRQKVAEERLRIKGKFIKKRRALQILGLTTPISTVEVKRMLNDLLKDKSLKEIEDIIKKEQLED